MLRFPDAVHYNNREYGGGRLMHADAVLKPADADICLSPSIFELGMNQRFDKPS